MITFLAGMACGALIVVGLLGLWIAATVARLDREDQEAR